MLPCLPTSANASNDADSAIPRYSLVALSIKHFGVAIVVVALTICVVYPPFQGGKTIHYDGGGYHIWTHAIADRTLDFAKYKHFDSHTWIYLIPRFNGELRHGFDDVRYWSFDDERLGEGVPRSERSFRNKFPPGCAILRFPIMVWFIDRSDRPTISKAEHVVSSIFGAVLLLATCIVTLRTCQLWGISSVFAQTALLFFIFGTGLFHYATYDASYSHNDSAFGLSVLLYCLSRSAKRFPVSPYGVAVLTTWLLMVRSTNLIPIGMLTAFFCLGIEGHRISRRTCIAVGVGVLVGLGSVVVLNSLAEGRLIFSGYASEQFQWDQSRAWSVVTAYEQGLVLYSPLVGLVLIATVCVRSTRLCGIALVALIAVYSILYGYWHWWTLGAGFGHRGFVELMPLAIPVFAAVLQQLSVWPRRFVLILACLCMLVTVKLMLGLWCGFVWSERMTCDQYWNALWCWTSW